MKPILFRNHMRALPAGAIAVAISLAGLTAGAQPAEQARLDPAVQAYLAKQQADERQASDTRVASYATAILSDPSSPAVGNPKADVTIVEFFDYTCVYCKAVEPRLEQILKTDKGVKLVLKEFPILTPESLVASRVALAAAKQGKYERLHFALMNFKGRLQNEVIFDTAKSIGLDMDRLRKDMDAPDVTAEIIGNFNLARALRIFQTPGFIAGGHVLTGPSADIDFPKVVAEARAQPR
jgi:protein-disulfide isomerase